MPGMTDSPKRRWFYPTPGWLILALLAGEGLLWLSERYKWFGFHKGWTVLIAVAVVGVAILVMLLWFIASLLFRWRFQFSIRSLLVLTVAVAIPCSWLAVEMKKAKGQREVVNEVTSAGGGVQYDWEFDAGGNLLPNAKPSGPGWLRNPLGDDFFSNVIHVWIGNTKVTDEGLERLKGFTQLQGLSLERTRVTDKGLEHLKGLMQLQVLLLDNTQVTDKGLEHLKGLTELYALSLIHTQVTDKGLEHLKGLTQLHDLRLNNTQVTDIRPILRHKCTAGSWQEGVQSCPVRARLCPFHVHFAGLDAAAEVLLAGLLAETCDFSTAAKMDREDRWSCIGIRHRQEKRRCHKT